MLTLLLILLIKKFRNAHIASRYKRHALHVARATLLFISGYIFLEPLNGQGVGHNTEYRRYNVVYKGNTMGTVMASRRLQGNEVNISLQSDMRFRIVFPISIKSKEEVLFENDVLTRSTIWRQVNGKDRLNRVSNHSGNSFSVLSLYFTEPVNESSAFSHAFGKKLVIKKISNGRYRIDLPDGNFNIYNYEDGICKSVEVTHSFLHFRFVLNETTSLK
jgi:hypothetical protein